MSKVVGPAAANGNLVVQPGTRNQTTRNRQTSRTSATTVRAGLHTLCSYLTDSGIFHEIVTHDGSTQIHRAPISKDKARHPIAWTRGSHLLADSENPRPESAKDKQNSTIRTTFSAASSLEIDFSTANLRSGSPLLTRPSSELLDAPAFVQRESSSDCGVSTLVCDFPRLEMRAEMRADKAGQSSLLHWGVAPVSRDKRYSGKIAPVREPIVECGETRTKA
jgi:hypothetical protein